MNQLQSKLEQYIEAPDVPDNSFEVGWEYGLIGQYASAMGYYLKCAELTDNDLIAYECLMRKAICFRYMGEREEHVKGCCKLAAALLPNRPEAYHFLSQSYEHTQQWQDAYAIARMAQKLNAVRDKLVFDFDGADLNYPGYFALPFQEAVALWWIGRFQDCIDKFKEVKELDGITPDYVGHCQWNIDNLEGRDADALAGIKKNNSTSVTDKEEIIRKMLAEK